MSTNRYTKLQQDIIDGKIDIKTVHGTAIAKLRSKALALGDADVVRMAEEQLTVKKENARLRNIERVKKSYWERKEKGFECRYFQPCPSRRDSDVFPEAVLYAFL